MRVPTNAREALVMENILKAQQVQEYTYNKGAQLRTFESGDRVVLLLPTPELLAQW